jgi:hypothetical protein
MCLSPARRFTFRNPVQPIKPVSQVRHLHELSCSEKNDRYVVGGTRLIEARSQILVVLYGKALKCLSGLRNPPARVTLPSPAAPGEGLGEATAP